MERTHGHECSVNVDSRSRKTQTESSCEILSGGIILVNGEVCQGNA